MNKQELIPHLFRTEYSKIVAVLCKLFGISQIEIAEDIVSESFLLAAETWGKKGIPEYPKSWIYAVAKNKTKDYIKRKIIYTNKVEPIISEQNETTVHLDFSEKHIADSQLEMMFAICNPSLTTESQISLALRYLCGFGVEEIAQAFLTSKSTINKRLFRTKNKWRNEKLSLLPLDKNAIKASFDNVLTILYLLFNEGYHSESNEKSIRKELSIEAMRLCYLLLGNKLTNLPKSNALLALMCFHASRYNARKTEEGHLILYEDQDRSKWDQDLIKKGNHFLNLAAEGIQLSKYHLEAGIAYWHTQEMDNPKKWTEILKLYNYLLQIEYSPIAALNRTYAYSRVYGNEKAIQEAYKINLLTNHYYHLLMAEFYNGIDQTKAIFHLKTALSLAKTKNAKDLILTKLKKHKNM